MGNVPETSENDLRVMGITPEMIRDALVAAGMPVNGNVVGYYLPEPGDFGDDKIQKARNYAKSDWVPVEHRAPTVLDQHEYNQKFLNFDADDSIQVQYDHSVTVTTGVDYSQTNAFNVNVNASLPIGGSGAMIGFSATMSTTDVKNKSWSKSEQHSTSFPVTVPGHEGRLVTEVTTETSETTVYEANIGVENAVGIEVDPAWYKPNEYYWFYDIQSVFPNYSSSSKINRAGIDTDVDTAVSKVLPPGDANGEPIKDDILAFESHVAKQSNGSHVISRPGP
ncbi:hypothetical protein BDV96DRAFT_178804 [Lophiotrema nucula]|uniref:Uncharacterized protein n=1 Tax=Lophiotrema nucula TaxID=690887 RepID=A0A6A5YY72_9PLEO|nr:hypothetical protein BDV96DRAFT_178804 [Lophiotrema nucula]